MPTTLTVRDETTSGAPVHELVLEVLTERITVRELIRSRVYQEVQDFNLRQPSVFRGLVQPSDTERQLNGYHFKKPRQLDWKKQFDKAVEAFEKSQVLILIDDKQAESLEDEIVVAPATRVSFLRLTPLVGG